ncbi:MAG TPA: hypothetical protein VEB19_04855 [Gemmatimonadaceae bacterium]|nr:hypothetical protein [Gemmatimonadaceae bacterium]
MRVSRWPSALVILSLACADTNAPEPRVALELETPTVALTQGTSQVVNVSVDRTNFDKPVTLTVAGTLPAGVTATLTQSTLTASQSTTFLTVAAAGNATPGAVTLAVSVAGEGVASETQPLEVTVTLRGSYTLGVVGPAAVAAVGGAGSATISLARTDGNASDVTLVASNVPAGVTATFSQSPASGTGTTLTFVASGAAVAGSYSVTITGSAAGHPTDQTTVVPLEIITAPPTTGVSLALCQGSAPLWFAFQNEGYAWQRVLPTGSAFAFDATEKVSVAFTVGSSGSFTTFIYHLTRADLDAFSDSDCPGTRSHTGSVTGVTAGQAVQINMGVEVAEPSLSTPAFSLQGLPERTLDLVGVRGAVNQGQQFTPDRILARRAISASAAANLGTLDFAGVESFAPAATTLTFSGASASEVVLVSNLLLSANVTTALLQQALPTSTSLTLHSVPADQLGAGDVQQTLVEAFNSAGLIGRSVIAFQRDPADRTVTFGPLLPLPTVSIVAAAPYGRMRGVLGLQNEYPNAVRFSYCQGTLSCTKTIRHVLVAAHRPPSAAQWDAVIPDFTGTPGFNPSWMLSAASPTFYAAEAYSAKTTVLFGAAPTVDDGYGYAFHQPGQPAFRNSTEPAFRSSVPGLRLQGPRAARLLP